MCQGSVTVAPPAPVPEKLDVQKVENENILSEKVFNALLKDMIKACAHPMMKGMKPDGIHGVCFAMVPELGETVLKLRNKEDALKKEILDTICDLWRKFSRHGIEMALIARGLVRSEEGPESANGKKEYFELACLECKDRLRCILENYGWLDDFFRYNPAQQHQDSFRFTSRIPPKPGKVKVDVLGMGIGGGFAASGLAKAGCDVSAFEKRSEGSVGSRYQTASWTMYESAKTLLDEEGYDELNKYRQTINFEHPDGATSVFEANRCTIVLGGAVDTGVRSARRCGADVHFEFKDYIGHRDELREKGEDEEPDIVAVFCGAHTAKIFDVQEEMGYMEWPETKSDCYLWLSMKESEHNEEFTARKIVTGDEKWCYSISSARDEMVDIHRAIGNVKRQQAIEKAKLDASNTSEDVNGKYEKQMKRLESVQKSMEEGSTNRYDYIFTSAPKNPINDQKLMKAEEDGLLVVQNDYSVIPTFSLKTTFTEGKMTEKFGSKVVVCGGDSTVAPNPLAARGATVASENAMALVKMAVAMGHIKVMMEDLQYHNADAAWMAEMDKLKALLPLYFDALSLSENFVQWTQTIVCNLCSHETEYFKV